MQSEKVGRPVPDSAREPEIDLEDVFFLRAFLDLQHDKTEMRSIPWSAINDYGDRYKLSPGLFEKLKEVTFFCNSQLEAEFAKRKEAEIAFRERQDKAAKRRR